MDGLFPYSQGCTPEVGVIESSGPFIGLFVISVICSIIRVIYVLTELDNRYQKGVSSESKFHYGLMIPLRTIQLLVFPFVLCIFSLNLVVINNYYLLGILVFWLPALFTIFFRTEVESKYNSFFSMSRINAFYLKFAVKVLQNNKKNKIKTFHKQLVKKYEKSTFFKV